MYGKKKKNIFFLETTTTFRWAQRVSYREIRLLRKERKKERKKNWLDYSFHIRIEKLNFPRRFIFTNIFQITNLNFSTGEKFVGIEITRERERDGKIDMADWWSRDGRMVDSIGPRFDVNDSISRWSRARSVAPERVLHHHHHHTRVRNRCSVAKEVVARVGVTTNCIVTRKLRDYGARGKHRECGACARREVARHGEKMVDGRRGKGWKMRDAQRDWEGGRGREEEGRNNYCLYFQIPFVRERERKFKLLASLNFHCPSLPFRIQCSSNHRSYPSIARYRR